MNQTYKIYGRNRSYTTQSVTLEMFVSKKLTYMTKTQKFEVM